VSEFLDLFHAHHSEGREDAYDCFIRIVNEYVKVNSSSEVNIDSATREAILAFSERSEYESLDAVSRRFLLKTALITNDVGFGAWNISTRRGSQEELQSTGELKRMFLHDKRMSTERVLDLATTVPSSTRTLLTRWN